MVSEDTRDLTTSINNLAKAPPGTASNRTTINILADTLAKALQNYHNIFHKPERERQAEQRVPIQHIANTPVSDEEHEYALQRVPEQQLAPESGAVLGIPHLPNSESDILSTTEADNNERQRTPNKKQRAANTKKAKLQVDNNKFQKAIEGFKHTSHYSPQHNI